MASETYKITAYEQGNMHYLSLIMPYHAVQEHSEILTYGKSEYGYQRTLAKIHYMKIARYLLQDKDAILPSAIILGADRALIKSRIDWQNEEQGILSLMPDEKLFRVVDGQHRLRGLQEACHSDERFKDFSLNVIIMLVEPQQRTLELQAFSDLNAKSKRLKIDLINLARDNYQLLLGKDYDYREHIALEASYRLKDNADCVWSNGIKFAMNFDNALGIVSIKVFTESIVPLIELQTKNSDFSSYPLEEKFSYIETTATQIADFIGQAWKHILKKWPSCFARRFAFDMSDELVPYFYNKKFYIQRMLGVRALNALLVDSAQKYGLGKDALRDFNKKIIKSRITTTDWLVGSIIFSGLSSENSIKKVKRLITSVRSESLI